MSAAGARDDAEARLGETDGRIGGENSEVGGEGELEAASERDGGDGGDGGDGELREGGKRRAEVREEFVRPREKKRLEEEDSG